MRHYLISHSKLWITENTTYCGWKFKSNNCNVQAGLKCTNLPVIALFCPRVFQLLSSLTNYSRYGDVSLNKNWLISISSKSYSIKSRWVCYFSGYLQSSSNKILWHYHYAMYLLMYRSVYSILYVSNHEAHFQYVKCGICLFCPNTLTYITLWSPAKL